MGVKIPERYRIGEGEEWKESVGERGGIESWLLSELYTAFYLARKGKRATLDEQKFETRLDENIHILKEDILNGTYKPRRGIAFIVKDPVVREIFAAPFRDRVVHHFLYNGIYDWWDRRLIYDCYSCRVGKGTLFGIQRLAKHIHSASRNGRVPTYVIKMDIQGYFMSLPRTGLFKRVTWGLERQFPNKGPRYKLYKEIWREVIFDDPTEGVRLKGSLADWDNLPKNKSLFNQPAGQGIVIGNLSSQLLSNIYLDSFDRFIKYDLKYKHYGRYVDDFYIVVREEELGKAKKDLELIRKFLTSLGLTLHPKKTKIQPISRGTQFLGAVAYPHWTVPARRVKNNFLKALLEVEAGKKDLETIISYMGILKHLNSGATQAKIFERAGLEYRV